jgi:hypothetical protein
MIKKAKIFCVSYSRRGFWLQQEGMFSYNRRGWGKREASF